ELTLKVEKHFGQPQDVEWAIRKDLEPPESLVLLQARPQKISKGKFGLM
ncbi:MAG TPA: phosphoenolpyruvate synthase, partial [Thermococcus litoralis]|nr:phosphoenolpyruvate synthase [Thermococcus litoralis]